MNANACGTQGFRSLISNRQVGGKQRGTKRRRKDRRMTWTATSFQLIHRSMWWQKVLESQGDNQEPRHLQMLTEMERPILDLLPSFCR